VPVRVPEALADAEGEAPALADVLPDELTEGRAGVPVTLWLEVLEAQGQGVAEGERLGDEEGEVLAVPVRVPGGESVGEGVGVLEAEALPLPLVLALPERDTGFVVAAGVSVPEVEAEPLPLPLLHSVPLAEPELLGVALGQLLEEALKVAALDALAMGEADAGSLLGVGGVECVGAGEVLALGLEVGEGVGAGEDVVAREAVREGELLMLGE
jgi:hypothetical protein